jgi:hypothetical protein
MKKETLEESMKFQPSIKGEIWIEEQMGKDLSDECGDAGIIGIENGTIVYSPDAAKEAIKGKLSELCGKHTKQSEKEIDDQINDLRDWER